MRLPLFLLIFLSECGIMDLSLKKGGYPLYRKGGEWNAKGLCLSFR